MLKFHLDFCALSGINRFFKNTVVYMNSIANYSIWRHRNEIRYDFIDFNINNIVCRFVRSIGARKHSQSFITKESLKIQDIDRLYEIAKRTGALFPFDNG